MKFFHIADLHLGKRVCGFSMLEDQRYILEQILDLAKREQPDGILLAGDLYDKQLPSAETVELADWFLTSLSMANLPIWAISGNHDSPERVAYGAQMLEHSGIHLSRVFDGKLQRYTVKKDEKEQADIWLFPFVRPSQVRRFFPDRVIETTEQAVQAVLSTAELDKDRPNLLLMHQFIAGASVCESEEISVGGSDQVSASLLDDFDYVALGHLHGPQSVGRETVRYCGSPLKYSFSEVSHKKSVTVVELDWDHPSSKPWGIRIRTLPLTPLHDLRKIKGPIAELVKPEVVQAADPEDYLHVTLTDKEGVMDAVGKLRTVYPNLMQLEFESAKIQEMPEEIRIDEKTPEELFEEFFEQQTGEKMNERQRAAAAEAWKS